MKKINDFCFEIEKEKKMRVPGRIFVTENMLSSIREECFEQVKNVATLPGIIKASYAMPDIHWGYGFPIGGVAAFDLENGIISPGGVGYDINCGVRLMSTGLSKGQVSTGIKKIINEIYKNVPVGVGSTSNINLNLRNAEKVFKDGIKWVYSQGIGNENDMEYIEDQGCVKGAIPENISKKAFERGRRQLGTLGAGNHFIEIGYVESIYDKKVANIYDIFKDQIMVLIHTGSRGFGYQVCDDYIKLMIRAAEKYSIDLPDRQLCCAPFKSEEGQQYFGAMNCAVNYAFANREIIAHNVRKSLETVLEIGPRDLNLKTIYEIAHNIAKLETHKIEGKEKQLVIHRKGATRAFPEGHKNLPSKYISAGQPVLIPGDMGRYSYIATGTQKALNSTFGSVCHGAGRLLGRRQAIRKAKGRDIQKELEKEGIFIKAFNNRSIIEEMPEAYKNIDEVVDTAVGAGLVKKIARLKPLGVIKG
ncbi:MAG: RtcB family protein [Candidatus Aureabacteria bacterium]|nr:RtcB family protein [Candidatus Auribacterota bacterium]